MKIEELIKEHKAQADLDTSKGLQKTADFHNDTVERLSQLQDANEVLIACLDHAIDKGDNSDRTPKEVFDWIAAMILEYQQINSDKN